MSQRLHRWEKRAASDTGETFLQEVPVEITDDTAQLFLDWMEGVFVGTPEAMRLAVKIAMTKALEGTPCPYV